MLFVIQLQERIKSKLFLIPRNRKKKIKLQIVTSNRFIFLDKKKSCRCFDYVENSINEKNYNFFFLIRCQKKENSAFTV